jgi:hypothetical protein
MFVPLLTDSTLPLRDLEDVLDTVEGILGQLPPLTWALALDAQVTQCRQAITYCRRYKFDASLRSALTAKVRLVREDTMELHREWVARGRKHAAAPER